MKPLLSMCQKYVNQKIGFFSLDSDSIIFISNYEYRAYVTIWVVFCVPPKLNCPSMRSERKGMMFGMEKGTEFQAISFCVFGIIGSKR